MTKKPTTFLKRNRPDPLTKKESGRLWQRVASEVGFSDIAVPVSVSYAAFRYQPAFAFVIGLLLVFTGSYTAEAADAAGPGDLLYPLDLALEDARLAVTPAGKRGPLHLRYAMERIDELSETTAAVADQANIGDQEQLRSHQRYVEKYLNDVSNELSPGDQARVRQRFMQVIETNGSTRQHQQKEVQTPSEEAEIHNTEANQEPARTQERKQPETQTYTPTSDITNAAAPILHNMQQTQTSETTTEQEKQTSDNTEPAQNQGQTKNNTDQTDPDTTSGSGNSSSGSGSGSRGSSGSGSSNSGGGKR